MSDLEDEWVNKGELKMVDINYQKLTDLVIFSFD